VGFLCAADGKTFAEVLDNVRAGALSTTDVRRLHGTVDGTPLPFPILNDVLVAHVNPAATARYIIEHGGRRDDQKSSGVWLCTPAGSTAAVASAGGVVQNLDDERLQLRVREAYAADGDGPAIRELLFRHDDEVTIVSRMREGRLYLDGPHEKVSLPMGAHLVIHGRCPPLALYVTEEMNARREQARLRQRVRRSSDAGKG
jgi:NAD+ kinase